MNAPKRFALMLGLLAIIAFASPLARAQTAAQPIPTISAIGSATSASAPDQVSVSLGVQAVGKTSAEAQDALNKVMDKVIRAVKDTQLRDLVVQTQGLSLQPEYEREVSNSRTREPRITGYRASNTINARTADVDKVGKLIDAGVAAGANQIWGINFSLKDSAAAQREAIIKATADAKARAEAIADGLGVKLGRVLHATTGSAQVRPMYRRMEMSAMADAGGGAPTPIESGDVTVTADITVEFAIAEAPK